MELDPLTAKLLAQKGKNGKLTPEELTKRLSSVVAISFDDVVNGTGEIVHLPKNHIVNWDNHRGVDDLPDNQAPTGSKGNRNAGKEKQTCGAGGGGIMKFGKFKDKTHEWVKKNEPGYWRWATENIPSMERYK